MYVLLTVVTCPALAGPTNGGVTLSPNNNNYQTMATYTCTTGYVLTPNNGGMRTCQAGGQWSGVVPTCPRELISNSGLLCVAVNVSSQLLTVEP